jgi:hypothetical protein
MYIYIYIIINYCTISLLYGVWHSNPKVRRVFILLIIKFPRCRLGCKWIVCLLAGHCAVLFGPVMYVMMMWSIQH